MDDIIAAALSSLIVSVCVLLFKNVKQQKHAQIQNRILTGLAIFPLMGIIGSFSMVAEVPVMGMMTIGMCILIEYFIIKKIYMNYQRMKNNYFTENETNNNFTENDNEGNK